MKLKDFSEIEQILQANGVGFIKCFFRSNLYPEDIDFKPTKPWRIDFSDGTRYLGSLTTNTDAVGFSTVEGEPVLVYDLYIGKKETLLGQELKIVLTYTVSPIQGECIIDIETDTSQKRIRRKRG